MRDTSIPVDLFNPGQVFACLGFMEATLRLCGEAQAGFDWSVPANARFRLSGARTDNPFADVLGFLARANIRSVAPYGSKNETTKWSIETQRLKPGAPFPFPSPSSPATLPAELYDATSTLRIDSWGDTTRRDNVKFWGGSAGYPGVGLVRDALALARPYLADAAEDPFAVSAPQSSSFRFDWRRDYIPIDAGFSLNVHSHITPRGYPVVELLAALGLAHARPTRQTKLLYRYAVLGRNSAHNPEQRVLFPPPLLRAALGGTVETPFPQRRFTMNLDWPAKAGQARCITTVTEDPD